MTELNKETIIRCRAVIIHDGKLLGVKHAAEADYFALPGGHLEWGESILDCMKREVFEELGVEPKIGRLLYVNNIIDRQGKQSIGFFFEITNPEDFTDISKLGGTHKYELFDIRWLQKGDGKNIKPPQLRIELDNGTILSDTVRFL